LNSFANRVTEGVAQLDVSLQSAGVLGGATQIFDSRTEDIRVRYVNVTTTPFGRTFIKVRSSTANCLGSALHQVSNVDIGLVTVEVNQRADWFTQENNRRALWESCVAGNTSYTCSKWFDFGSTFTHELMHSLYLRHPQDVDQHTGSSVSNGPEAQQAHCNSTLAWDGADDATVCPADGDAPTSETRYESSRRSVESYDVSSVSTHYGIN
jgi:hypothetical protein